MYCIDESVWNKGNLKLTFESKDEQFSYVAEKNFADSALRGNYDLIHAKLFLDNFANSRFVILISNAIESDRIVYITFQCN